MEKLKDFLRTIHPLSMDHRSKCSFWRSSQNHFPPSTINQIKIQTHISIGRTFKVHNSKICNPLFSAHTKKWNKIFSAQNNEHFSCLIMEKSNLIVERTKSQKKIIKTYHYSIQENNNLLLPYHQHTT